MFINRIFLRAFSSNVDVSVPLKKSFPEVGSSISPIRLRRVVFPAPEGPKIEMMFPLSIFKSTLFTALICEEPT